MALVLLLPSLAVAVSPFVDVVPGKFYETPVNWAFNNHITTGKDATHFDPGGQVTRGETVTFLKRYDDNIVQPAITGLGNTIGKSLGQLTCGAGQVAKSDGTNWACGNDIDTTIADTTIPNTDTLAGLGCATNQVARYDGTNWVCNTITAHYRVSPGTTTKVDAAISSSAYTSIAVGTDGFPVVSYYDNTLRDLKVVHCANETCSSKDTPVTLDSIGDVGRYTSITIGTDNFPIISYLDATNADLKAVHCTVATCATRDTSITLDSPGSVGSDSSIAVGADNLPIISYYDAANGDLKVVHCADTACSTHDTPVTLDTGGTVGNVGNYTSIAIGADNLPIISYLDTTSGDLKVVHCADTACTNTPTIITLDTGGNVGYYTSIAIGADNLPIISYLDATNADLKAVHCTVATCATYDMPVVIDATAASGMNFTALAIGTGGLPVIAYRGTSNNVLRAVECTDPGCLDHYRIITLDSTTNNNYEGSIATTNSGRPIVSYRGGSTDVLVSAIELVMTGITFG